MCGIAGIHRLDRSAFIPGLNELADALMLGIEHRGQDATGFGCISDDGSAFVQKASMKACDFIKSRRAIPFDARTVLLHTRLATNGSIHIPENNHPTICETTMAVHNGVIWNDYQLFNEYVNTPRMGQVDSEIIPALTNAYGGLEYVEAWAEEIDGSFAVAIADSAHVGEVVLMRGFSSPLYVYATEKIVVWASTMLTIKNAWAKVFGTPPAPEKIRDVNEGTILYLDTEGISVEATFTPATQWMAAYESVHKYTAGNLPKVVTSGDGQNVSIHDTESDVWLARCGICDSFTEEDDLTEDSGMLVCEDCMRYVDPSYDDIKAAEAAEPTKGDYATIAAAVLAAQDEREVISKYNSKLAEGWEYDIETGGYVSRGQYCLTEGETDDA